MTSNSNEVLRYVGKHVLSLNWLDRTPGGRGEANRGQGTPFALSCFIISVFDEWFLVTAGHVLKDIEAATSAGQRLERWFLHDGWGMEAKWNHPVPIAFDKMPKLYVGDETGYDYGLIYLGEYYRSLLAANSVVALDEKGWTEDLPDKFDGYLLLGFPSQLVVPEMTTAGMKISQSVVVVRVEEVGTPPEHLRKDTPRFYGTVTLPPQFNSIDGMSGSPILGYKKGDHGMTRYWVVAVQSSWDGKVVAACPIHIFASFIARKIEEAVAQKLNDSEEPSAA